MLVGLTSQRRVDCWLRGDRAGCPIEAAQNRRFCEAGPVKIRRAGRVVVDIVRDRAARKPGQ